MGVASSRLEVFGNDNISGVQGAISALVRDGYLVSLPTSHTADPHGGVRYEVTAAGRKSLGEPELLSRLRVPGKKGVR